MPDFLHALLSRAADFSRLPAIEHELRAEFGGRWVYIAQRTNRAMRNSLIRDSAARGDSYSRIAAAFGMSERQIYRIVRSRA
jgi:Mor family transcriptional regulator